MSQVFRHDPNDKIEYANGAIAYGSGLPFRMYNFAKVLNCPIDGTNLRRACYQSGDADTAFSVPGNTYIDGHYRKGYFTFADRDGMSGLVFRILDTYRSGMDDYYAAGEVMRAIEQGIYL